MLITWILLKMQGNRPTRSRSRLTLPSLGAPIKDTKVERPPAASNRDQVPRPLFLCSKCSSSIGRSKPNTCTSDMALENTIAKLPEKLQDQVCSSILKGRFKSSLSPDEPTSLSRVRGRPLKVTVPDQKKVNADDHSFKREGFCDLQKSQHLSLHQGKSIAHFIRKVFLEAIG